mmetsp:Transcript_16784/g.50281  ORF Transcript_16784/g.50281 Transcript_16784/m.50281 type:complete len:209 (+) Transcript_16784:1487-2113(+)
MTRTWPSAGKCSATAALIVLAISPNMTLPHASKAPVKPPPMSSSVMSKPSATAASKMWRAAAIASEYAARLAHAEPTWKETPTTARPSACAARSKPGASATSAPYLRPSGTRAAGSSARMRSTSLKSGLSAATLCSSDSVSNVVKCTPCARAKRMSLARLHGCAKMMRAGSTPMLRTVSSSPLEAQSKPAPMALSRRSMPRSGWHLTA